MSFFSSLYRHGLWISVPVFLLALALLVHFITSVIRVVKQAQLLRLPLVERQQVEFTAPGRVVLCTEGPRLSSRFAKLHYELSDDARPLEGRTTWFRARTSGISTVRTETKSYDIPAPGRYTLLVKGLPGDSVPDAQHRLVFMRPHLARSIAYVVGIVFASLLLIGSVVLFGLRVTSAG